MDFEMSLQDALNRGTETLREKVGVFNTDITKKTIEYIKCCAEQASIFSAELREFALEEQVKFAALLESEEGAER